MVSLILWQFIDTLQILKLINLFLLKTKHYSNNFIVFWCFFFSRFQLYLLLSALTFLIVYIENCSFKLRKNTFSFCFFSEILFFLQLCVLNLWNLNTNWTQVFNFCWNTYNLKIKRKISKYHQKYIKTKIIMSKTHTYTHSYFWNKNTLKLFVL